MAENRGQGKTLTWSEVYTQATKLADSLQHAGFQKGDPLAIWSPTISEWVIGQFAAARLGLPYVTLNPAYKAHELEPLLQNINCSGILYPVHVKNTSMHFDQFLNSMKNPPKLQIYIDNEYLVDQKSEVYEDFLANQTGKLSFSDLVKSGNQNANLDAYAPNMDDLNMIQFTSGTTGTPKAAALTNHGVVNNAIRVASRIGVTESTKIACGVPLFHCFGNVLGTLLASHQGNSIAFAGHTWSPKNTLNLIEKYKLNHFYGTPTMFIDLFSVVEEKTELKSKLKTLKRGLGSGSLLPPELIKKADSEFDIKTQIVYGSTECSPVITGCYLDDPFDKRVNTVGRALDHIELKIVNHKNQVMPIGQAGEICSRGFGTFPGYLHDPKKTAEAVEHNWFKTGDLGIMDEEGYVKIVGRIKDMIIRGGENVYPSEIEGCLLKHELVLDAQVVGAPDFRLGEVVAVYVRLRN